MKKKKGEKILSNQKLLFMKKIDYSIVKVEKTQRSNEFCKTANGKEYVKVTVKIENKSDKKIAYNALDWQMVNANGVEDAWESYSCDDDALSSGDLDTGRTIIGVLVWKQKINDKNLRLRYYDNLFDDDYKYYKKYLRKQS